MLVDNNLSHKPILVVMGVSGCGKSTVAALLARRLGWDFKEGDQLHPPANVTKMSSGIALTDDDRWPWLDRIAGWIFEHTESGRPGIITCSALKRIYRDRLRDGHVCFVHLTGERESIDRRMRARSNHFMPAALLDSQIATLEPPGADENTLEIYSTHQSADEAAESIIDLLGLRPGSRELTQR